MQFKVNISMDRVTFDTMATEEIRDILSLLHITVRDEGLEPFGDKLFPLYDSDGISVGYATIEYEE